MYDVIQRGLVTSVRGETDTSAETLRRAAVAVRRDWWVADRLRLLGSGAVPGLRRGRADLSGRVDAGSGPDLRGHHAGDRHDGVGVLGRAGDRLAGGSGGGGAAAPSAGGVRAPGDHGWLSGAADAAGVRGDRDSVPQRLSVAVAD